METTGTRFRRAPYGNQSHQIQVRSRWDHSHKVQIEAWWGDHSHLDHLRPMCGAQLHVHVRHRWGTE